MRNKKSLYSLLRPISEEERARANYLYQARTRLGILTVYDSSHISIGNYTPSMYESISDYEADKNRADYLISTNQPVPKALESKLIAARIELENIGLLEKYQEV